MYIEPNTTIKILKNIPLDTTYEHTIMFSSLSAQSAWFSGKAKYTLDRNSYQRVQRGYMRVSIQAEKLYDCNYVMFQNSAFGTKWFYAFIKGVEYVNNGVSQIEFQIDIMQTWLFDYQLEECFVEREHSATDVIGGNIVPENLDIGDEVVANNIAEFDMNDMSVCMLVSNQGLNQGRTINNVYTPLQVYAGLSSQDSTSLNAIISSIVGEGQEDRIVAIYQYPSWLGDGSTTGAKTQTFNVTPNRGSLDGYTPKNKKLYTHPYNFILASNNNGQTATYKYEDWDTDDARGNFAITGVFISTPCIMAYPTDYRNIAKDYDSGLTLSSFPQCAWVGDAFKSWWAQNRASIATSGISTVLGAAITIGATAVNPALGAASAAVQFGAKVAQLNAGVNAASSVAGTLAKVSDLKNTPPQVHGQTQTESLNSGMRRVKFTFYRMSIKKEFARIVDDYFTRYGYATKRNKVPNRLARPHWTYTKTIGCTIKGSIPCDDADAICSIYNNGVTFWRYGDEVGRYDLDNTV